MTVAEAHPQNTCCTHSGDVDLCLFHLYDHYVNMNHTEANSELSHTHLTELWNYQCQIAASLICEAGLMPEKTWIQRCETNGDQGLLQQKQMEIIRCHGMTAATKPTCIPCHTCCWWLCLDTRPSLSKPNLVFHCLVGEKNLALPSPRSKIPKCTKIVKTPWISHIISCKVKSSAKTMLVDWQLEFLRLTWAWVSQSLEIWSTLFKTIDSLIL